MKANHSNKEKAAALARSSLRVKDIQILLDCGPRRATEVAKDFRRWFEEELGRPLYPGRIPTEHFIVYASIPEARILKYAREGY